ncbi:MAG: transposase [Sedimenticola sp.]
MDYIEPGKPNKNSFIERFNRSLRNEVLDLYLFRSLAQVRQLTEEWRMQYNEQLPHDSLGGLPPTVYANQDRKNSSIELQTDGEAYAGILCAVLVSNTSEAKNNRI